MKKLHSIMIGRLHIQQLRFVLVGVVNTAFDTSLYVLLVWALSSIVISSYISGTIAVVFGYTMHRKFTFRSQTKTPSSFLSFITVTLFGVWVLQPIVIYGSHSLIQHFALQLPFALDVIAPKLLAVLFVMFWNYIWYSQVVFRERRGMFVGRKQIA